jgi:two-component system chemotaxis response regulator CheY
MKTVLIVDDSEYMRALLKKRIRHLGITVAGEAASGAEGAEKYKELRPDIVTMDLAMDGGDGVEAIKEIMSFDPQAKILVVSSTAGQKPVVSEALALGAKGVVEKNSIDLTLIDSLNRLL